MSFITINEKPFNTFYIQSFDKVDDVVDNDGTEETIYKIAYVFANGSTIEETFDSENDRNDKYDSLLPESA